MCAGRRDFGFRTWTDWCGPEFETVFGRGRRGRGTRGRGRVFDRGDLKYAILKLLRDKPMHGYEVMQALAEESGGWYTPSPGSVYPALQMLQDQGHVESEEQAGGKRVYRITADGRRFLEEHSERVDDVMDRVSDFAERFTAGDMGELSRAFVQLAQVSWQEAFRRRGDAERIAELKEIIERATREMRSARRRPESGTE